MTAIKKLGQRILIPGMLLVCAARILLGVRLGSWIDGIQYWDEALMIRYADLRDHFGNPFLGSTVKYMGFPLFLWLVHKLPLVPYTAWLGGLWCTGGILAYSVCRKMGMPKWGAFFFFVYFTFLPEAFSVDSGTRIYRNAIVGPISLIALLLMVHMGLYLWEGETLRARGILLACLTGGAAVYAVYIKEDGLWIAACLALATLVYGAESLIRGRKRAGWIVCALLPALCAGAVSLGYRAVNYRYFGVFETNTRTSGELGRFVESVYRIASDERTTDLWTPRDAIDKAFDASPTLSADPAFLEAVHTSVWLRGNIELQPVIGDFLGWVLTTEYDRVYGWEGEAEKEAYFRRVNREIDAAFASGALERETGRIRLLPSAGSKSTAEILAMRGQVLAGFRSAILLDGYEAAIREIHPEDETAIAVTRRAAELTHQPYLEDASTIADASGRAARLCSLVFRAYRLGNPVLLAGALLWLLRLLIRFFRRRPCGRRSAVCAWMSVLFFGIAFAYDFSIAWFSTFLHADGVNMYWINFYVVALPVLLGLAGCFGWCSAAALPEAGRS